MYCTIHGPYGILWFCPLFWWVAIHCLERGWQNWWVFIHLFFCDVDTTLISHITFQFLVGGFQYFIYSPRTLGENSHFDEHIFPPTKFCCKHHPVLSQPFHTPRKSPPNRKNHPSVSWFYRKSLQAYDLSKTWWLRYLGTLKRQKNMAISMQGGPTSSYKRGWLRGICFIMVV